MQQRSYTNEELKALQQFSDLMGWLGIPIDLSKNDPNVHVEMKTPSFEYSIQPGFIIKFENKGETYFAICLTANRSIYVDKNGMVKGYLVNPTPDTPYKVLEVRQPTTEYFKLTDFDSMNLIWTRPVEKVKRSIADIEKELGLAPGSLEIM